MKKLIIVVAVFFTTTIQAQIKKATLQASGLTCSMCSNAIFKSLKSLDFVEKVDANIKNSSFDITFKPGSKAELDQLKDKVEDAGFFVASLTAQVHLNNIELANDTHVVIDGTTFHFLNIKNEVVNGEKTIKILDKGYVTAKMFKQNNKFTTKECYKTGKAAACCAKTGNEADTRIYHVTM